MMECTEAFTANGERFLAGPRIVTRVADDHPVLDGYAAHFREDPDQLGTLAWRSRSRSAERFTGPSPEERDEARRWLQLAADRGHRQASGFLAALP